MEAIDTLVVGAGVVGLAVADALARAGREVVLVEATGLIGSGVSSRSSEVIHSGIYYPAGSAKARLCVRGKHLLYEFCERHDVPHRRCGKLIVAPRVDQEPALQALLARGQANGVTGLRLLDRQAVQACEPALDVHAAIASATTGIVDSHALMLALARRAQDHGAVLVFKTAFERAQPSAGGWRVRLADGGGGLDCLARRLVLATGLNAPTLARAIEGLPPAQVPVERYARGNYFALAGRARFGPDVEWIERPSFEVNAARLAPFYGAIRRYWPGLPEGALRPDYAGVRPKIYEPHEPAADFRIDGPRAHGLAALVCLFGIESPGLTSALAIAEAVQAELLD